MKREAADLQNAGAWDTPATRDLIARALEEDIGAGDLTGRTCVPEEARARGRFVAQQALVVAGIELLPLVYSLRAASGGGLPGGLESIELKQASGRRARSGALLATVAGRARLLLECERVALNFLQHLSGVATLTRRFVEALSGTGVKILDTRKTTPGLRHLEKLAVAAGGGTNHRMGLYDAVLIKENYVAAAGGLRKALERSKDAARGRPPVSGQSSAGASRLAGTPGAGSGPQEVEIEVRNLEELAEALEAGATAILLDNFPLDAVHQAMAIARGRASIEISGGVTLENIRAYAEAGPGFISVGALTHSAPAADITFLLDAS